MIRTRSAAALAATALAAASLLSACSGSVSVGSKTVSASDVEDQIASQATQTPDDVSCPDDLEAKVDATLTCTATFEGTTYEIKVTVTSVDNGDVKFSIEQGDPVSE